MKLPYSRSLVIMLPLGFSSGLPLALTGTTLQAWLSTAGINIKTIGIFSLVGIPYAIKFIWSPLMDRFRMPWLDRRRGWIITAQALLVLGLAFMATLSPAQNQLEIGTMAMLVAFLSASQDIAIDAYRTELLRAEERGLGVAMTVTGYRISMLVSGALALILADHAGWMKTYLMMAACMAACMAATVISPRPEDQDILPRDIKEAVTGPLGEFFSRQNAMAFILLIVFYKLGDAIAGSLTTAFLIRGPGFSPSEVGAVNKAFGLISTMAGAFLGGWIMKRAGLFRSLLYFGCLQAVSNLGFTALALAGKSHILLIASVAFENMASGMGTAAFVALIMTLCNKEYTATQYALLSAISSVGRVAAGPPSGLMAAMTGWPWFFFLAACASMPGLLLLLWMKDGILDMENQ
ncbi:MAG: MFS transporter [Desulfobacteraceae bacterium]|nr:MFS transporter [Desulfobacteraceae bacterium]